MDNKINELKEIVVKANKELLSRNLVIYSWGNVSIIDREKKIVIIKPVGIPYDELNINNVSVVDYTGEKIDGPFNPSVDLPIHLTIYKNFKDINSIVHTHSTYATIWAQAERPIPCLGTTHADYFYGEIPCTRRINKEEVDGEKWDYERHTGNIIVETLKKNKIDPMEVPGILFAEHGPFTWGKGPWEAVHNSVVLEEIAKMAYGTIIINPKKIAIKNYLLDKHFLRKHGLDAYFDQDDFGER